MKKLIFFIILPFIISSCGDSSTAPVIKDGTYSYSTVSEESFTVYGKGGVVIPEANWNDAIKEYVTKANAEMNNEYMYMEDMTFNFNNGKITSYDGITEMVADYRIENDTIYISLDFGNGNILEMPLGIKKDDKTIEMHVYSFGYHTDFSSEYSSGNDFGGYDEAMDEYSEYFDSMGDEDYITINLRKVLYTLE